jgi:SAM-dependent methyltransferase
MMSDSEDYPLGYSETEARWLTEQGALLEELTADVLHRAGLERGMRVLDIGCGMGDVSLLAAQMVGSEGRVLGVDRATSSVETARALSRGILNVNFVQSELSTFETDSMFDALIGRFVLLYVPEPGDCAQALVALSQARCVAFQEYDMSQVAQAPCELFEQTRQRILAAFSAGGAELDMGTRLYSTFLLAGLPPPGMNAITQVGCGPTWHGYDYMAGVLRSLLPLIERSGIANVSEICIDTLADRLRNDAIANKRLTFLPRAVGAWARTGE